MQWESCMAYRQQVPFSWVWRLWRIQSRGSRLAVWGRLLATLRAEWHLLTVFSWLKRPEASLRPSPVTRPPFVAPSYCEEVSTWILRGVNIQTMAHSSLLCSFFLGSLFCVFQVFCLSGLCLLLFQLCEAGLFAVHFCVPWPGMCCRWESPAHDGARSCFLCSKLTMGLVLVSHVPSPRWASFWFSVFQGS